MPARSPATVLRNIKRTSRCGCRIRQPISSLLRATTARSRSAFRKPARYTDAHVSGERPMAEMRLVVAGAGGRMGRTLVKAIADSKDFTLAGALEDARS